MNDPLVRLKPIPQWRHYRGGPEFIGEAESVDLLIRKQGEIIEMLNRVVEILAGGHTDLDSGHDIAHDEQASSECEQGDQSRLPSDGEST